MEYKEICKSLKKLRRERMLSQQQVADVLGIDRSTYAYYELGKSMPGFDTMDKLTKLFSISYAELFSASSNPESKARFKKSDSEDNVRELRLSKLERSIILRVRLLPQTQQNDVLNSLGGKIAN